jgi:hypothetical protein
MIRNEARRRVFEGPAAALLLLLAGVCGCGESAGPEYGAIRLSATTTGQPGDIDPNGYQVTGYAPVPSVSLAATGTLILDHVTPGDVTLTLEGLASNCVASDAGPRHVTVIAGDTVSVAWALSCASPALSAIDLTFTAPADLDRGAMLVQIDQAEPVTVAAGTTHTFDGLAEGSHTVSVAGTTPNCRISGALQRFLFLPRGQNSSVTFTGDCVGGRLVFSSRGRLWLANADTTDLHELILPATISQLGARADFPALSPDGEQVAFAYGPELYIVRRDGSDARLVVSPACPNHIAWSPDGTKLAFSGYCTGDYEVYVVDVDGSNLRNISNHDPGRDERPTWSPDGSRIAFTSDRDGTGGPLGLVVENFAIFTVGVDGTDLTRISDFNCYYPEWSPDGSTIAFSANGRLSLMNPDGTGVRYANAGMPVYFNYPHWSPDGRMIVAIGVDGLVFVSIDIPGIAKGGVQDDFINAISWSR